MYIPTTLSLATTSILALEEFRLFRVRSSLLTKSLTISFPRGTEIFHFPRLPQICTLLYRVGFPIRTSTTITITGILSWLFAANHVLLRLFYPRHPYIALNRLVVS